VVETTTKLKPIVTARTHQALRKRYSAELSFRHEAEQAEKRHKGRLGTMLVGRHRHHARASQQTATQRATPEILHHYRQTRYEDVLDRMATTRVHDGGNSNSEAMRSGGRRLLEATSSAASQFFQKYKDWRMHLAEARHDKSFATAAVEMGEKLLAEYRTKAEHFKGVLVEDSFTRSIHWLKNLHPAHPSTGKDSGKTEEVEGEAGESTQGQTLPEQPQVLMPPGEPAPLKHRYGKWVQRIKELPILSAQLHTIGNETLQAFGYDPATRFMDFDPENRKSQCSAEITCG